MKYTTITIPQCLRRGERVTMNFSWDRLFLSFFVYSVIGWIGEVLYAFVVHRRFVNRGFLTGPYCPLYGFGGLGFVVLFQVLQTDNVFAVFFGSALFATALEYVTGWLLERLFHRRYWDYSNAPLNLGGYVCLFSTIAWGIAGVCGVRFAQPHIVEPLIALIPPFWRPITAIALTALFLFDTVVAVLQNINISQRLHNLHILAEQMRYRTFSGEATVDLRRRYDRLVEELHSIHARTLDAFPRMRSLRYENVLHSVREQQRIYRERFARKQSPPSKSQSASKTNHSGKR